MSPKGNVPFLSPQFVELVGHALKEAKRLELQLVINNGDGWSGSGGPWIKPEHSMKEITWSQIRVTSADNKKNQLT